jgi:hypothetical protein
VAPTLLRYLDLAVPEDMEGSAIEAPFEALPPAKFRPPMESGSGPGAGDWAGEVYNEEEARELEERLRELGYL